MCSSGIRTSHLFLGSTKNCEWIIILAQIYSFWASDFTDIHSSSFFIPPASYSSKMWQVVKLYTVWYMLVFRCILHTNMILNLWDSIIWKLWLFFLLHPSCIIYNAIWSRKTVLQQLRANESGSRSHLHLKLNYSGWFSCSVQQESSDGAERNRFLINYVDYAFDDFGDRQAPVYPGLSTVWGSLARSKVSLNSSVWALFFIMNLVYHQYVTP
jgi:hypothetical protein